MISFDVSKHCFITALGDEIYIKKSLVALEKKLHINDLDLLQDENNHNSRFGSLHISAKSSGAHHRNT